MQTNRKVAALRTSGNGDGMEKQEAREGRTARRRTWALAARGSSSFAGGLTSHMLNRRTKSLIESFASTRSAPASIWSSRRSTSERRRGASARAACMHPIQQQITVTRARATALQSTRQKT